MANEQLREYITSQLNRGVARDAIEKALLTAGWPAESVATELSALTNTSPVQPTVPTVEKKQHSEPVDMFADTSTANPRMNTAASDMPGLQPLANDPSKMTAGQLQKTALAPNMMQPAKNSVSLFPKGMKPQMVNGLSGRTQLIGIIGAVIIGVGLLAGGVYAYMNLAESGNRIGVTALNNLSNVQSASFAMTIVPQFENGNTFNNPLTNRPVTEVTLQLSGQASGLTTATPSQTATLVAKMTGNGGSDMYQAEVRSVNNTLYTKFGEIAGAPAITASVLQNQWFSLTSQSISAVNSAGVSNIDGRIIKQFSAAELTQLKNGLSSSGMVAIGKKEGSETIQNVETVKYPLTLSVAGTKQFVQSITPVLTARGITTAQIQAWQKTMESNGDITGSIWIGKQDKQIYQVQLALPVGGAGGVERIVVGITLWDHNKDVKIEIPSPVKPLDTVLLEAQRAAQTTTTIPTITTTEEGDEVDETDTTTSDLLLETDESLDTEEGLEEDPLDDAIDTEEIDDIEEDAADDSSTPSADSDEDGLTNAEEARYKTDPLNDDSDDDGFLDGEEVENGFNPNGDGKL